MGNKVNKIIENHIRNQKCFVKPELDPKKPLDVYWLKLDPHAIQRRRKKGIFHHRKDLKQTEKKGWLKYKCEPKTRKTVQPNELQISEELSTDSGEHQQSKDHKFLSGRPQLTVTQDNSIFYLHLVCLPNRRILIAPKKVESSSRSNEFKFHAQIKIHGEDCELI